jgi:hypothetical protein
MTKAAAAMTLALVASIALTGCLGDGDGSTPGARVSAGNSAPVISGTPLTAAVVGQAYRFAPTASDPDGDKLTFSVSNRPSWANFDAATGVLSGTPTASQVGSYGAVRITASDGRASASIGAFTIAVTSVGMGTVTVSWEPPTQNVDGSPLTALAGYRIEFGTSEGALDRTIEVTNPGLNTYVVENLAPGTYYFGIRAVVGTGLSSDLSPIVSTTIG